MTGRVSFKGGLLIASAAFFAAPAHAQAPAAPPALPSVTSTVATAPTSEGGANAVTLLPGQTPAQTVIVGTGELGGLEVYGLDGARKAAWPAGEVYGVDTRSDIEGAAGGQIVAGLDRRANQIRLFSATGQQLEAAPLNLGFKGEGLCLFRSARDRSLYAFALGAAGQIDQWLIYPTSGGKFSGSLVRRMHVSSEPSYCVADDSTGALYVTEDAVGVWKFDADPEAEPTPQIVDIVKFGSITEEVGGVAIVNGGAGANYLVAGNQTDNNFNLYDRDKDDKFIGRFTVQGIESASGLYGTRTGDGALLIADDRDAGANYRMVSWRAIADAMKVAPGGVQAPRASTAALVRPVVETKPVANDGDAADDPAIWVNAKNPAGSLVVTTDKQLGLNLYDMTGTLLHTSPDGKMNNVDLRDGFKLSGQSIVLVAASDRTHKSIGLYALDTESRTLRNVADGVQATGLGDPYGLCMYRGKGGKTYVFINDTDGRMRQWELLAQANGKVAAKLVRDFRFDTQAEGCVADDEAGALYVAEEDVALWRMGAEPQAGTAKTQVTAVATNKALKDDLEGVGLYTMPGGRGYIVVSSQGNNSYAVFKREGRNEFVGMFSVIANGPAGIDGISETDGLDVVSRSLGPAFPYGAMIAQDGRNVSPPENQNFKFVSWEDIASALKLPLPPRSNF